MTQTPKAVRMWCVYDPKGRPIIGSLKETRTASILWHCGGCEWWEFKRFGYRCLPMILMPVTNIYGRFPVTVTPIRKKVTK